MSVSNERRAIILERSLDVGRGAEEVTESELRALLDLADERDRFRELLEAVWHAWPRNITAATLNRIKAALEGKHD